MSIHEKLRKLRLEKRMSQQDVADLLHISQNAYSLIETGVTKIDEERIRQLAEVFNIPPFELLKDDSVNLNFYDKVENGYATYIQTLNAENKELIAHLTAQLQIKDEQIEKLTALLEKSLK